MTDYATISRRLKLLAHPERLRILDALRGSPECVCHLEALLGRPQPYISQQLRMLSKAGVIQGRREGANIFYRVIDPEILAWLELILGPTPSAARQHAPVDGCVCPKCRQTR